MWSWEALTGELQSQDFQGMQVVQVPINQLDGWSRVQWCPAVPDINSLDYMMQEEPRIPGMSTEVSLGGTRNSGYFTS